MLSEAKTAYEKSMVRVRRWMLSTIIESDIGSQEGAANRVPGIHQPNQVEHLETNSIASVAAPPHSSATSAPGDVDGELIAWRQRWNRKARRLCLSCVSLPGMCGGRRRYWRGRF
jgi:hypothetical protein